MEKTRKVMEKWLERGDGKNYILLYIYINNIYLLCGHFGGNFQKWSLAFCYSVNPALIEYLPYAWKCLKTANQKYRNKTFAHPGGAHRAYGKNCWGKNEKKEVLKNVQKVFISAMSWLRIRETELWNGGWLAEKGGHSVARNSCLHSSSIQSSRIQPLDMLPKEGCFVYTQEGGLWNHVA